MLCKGRSSGRVCLELEGAASGARGFHGKRKPSKSPRRSSPAVGELVTSWHCHHIPYAEGNGTDEAESSETRWEVSGWGSGDSQLRVIQSGSGGVCRTPPSEMRQLPEDSHLHRRQGAR